MVERAVKPGRGAVKPGRGAVEVGREAVERGSGEGQWRGAEGHKGK